MTVRYQVPIPQPVLDDAETWALLEGLRLVSVDADWRPPSLPPDAPVQPVKLCTVDDDNAPPGLAGHVVAVRLTREIGPGRAPRVLVDTRTVIS